MMLRVTDLRQWAYCPRIVYYQHRMPGIGKPTYKMEEGKSAQEMVERLEIRRTLQEYGWDGVPRRFGVWLRNTQLGLAGKLDLLLESTAAAAAVEFKLTSGDIGLNHKTQLAGYSLLIESELGKPATLGFVHRIPDGKVFPVAIDSSLRQSVQDAIVNIREAVSSGSLPEPTSVRQRCHECEYANFCADVW